MNEVEIVEGGHYSMQSIWFTDDLWIKKICKIKSWFSIVDWLVVSIFEDWTFEKTMTLKEFKSKVLYKINK